LLCFSVWLWHLVLASRVSAQPRTATAGQETDDESRYNLQRFVENREPNPGAAYQAAKDYMAKLHKEDDQYTRYLNRGLAPFEKTSVRTICCARFMARRTTPSGSALAKQVLNDDPEDVKVLMRSAMAAISPRPMPKTRPSMLIQWRMRRRQSNCSRR